MAAASVLMTAIFARANRERLGVVGAPFGRYAASRTRAVPRSPRVGPRVRQVSSTQNQQHPCAHVPFRRPPTGRIPVDSGPDRRSTQPEKYNTERSPANTVQQGQVAHVTRSFHAVSLPMFGLPSGFSPSPGHRHRRSRRRYWLDRPISRKASAGPRTRPRTGVSPSATLRGFGGVGWDAGDAAERSGATRVPGRGPDGRDRCSGGLASVVFGEPVGASVGFSCPYGGR